MPPAPTLSLDLGPMRTTLPAGYVETTRAVYADDKHRVQVSRFDDPAESPEAYSRQRQARAAEVSEGGAEVVLKESRKVDGRMAYLTVYRSREQEKSEDRAFLVIQIRAGRFAQVDLSGRAASALREPILGTIRVTSPRVDDVPATLTSPVSFGELSMSVPRGVTRRTVFSAEDRAAGITWRLDAEVLGELVQPNLSSRLPKPPEIEHSRDSGTIYRRADRVGAVITVRTADPELGTPGPVTAFASVVVEQRILIHVLGRAPTEVQARMLTDMTSILDAMTVKKEDGQ
jgi:hypothetical protein